MSPFHYAHEALVADGVPLADIAAEVGTPCYVYAASTMRERIRAFRQAFRGGPEPLFCYAVKANSNLAVIRLFAQEGAGADTVSGGEIARALAAGVAPSRIVYAGIAKTDEEIRFALQTGILQFNVESTQELLRIAEIAAGMGKTAPVALRINPDVAAGTHDKISTGRKHDKFGIPWDEAGEVFALAQRLEGIEPLGLHLHIGSQITRLEPFEAAYRRAVDLFVALRTAGVPLRRLDLGGGFGVPYKDEPRVEAEAFADLVRRLTRGLDVELVFEPGRSLVAEAGVILSQVIYLKEAGGRRFLVLDSGMNVLIRPAMYGAYHAVLPVREPRPDEELVPMDVVGPICESSDVLGRDRLLPLLRPGDLVAITGAGAYGSVMASHYNSRPSAAEVLVERGRFAVIKPHLPPERQFADERIPDWLGGSGKD
ncbi:diaminopimelate decarboxylase [Benzoatithermus flavus]|uniref:Diaminopimelate decarboxylase n=1 Tax=Benzoatithermus flavus TaxID=3108223 RepID=A0ABU8XP08_9PROT